jgi:ATP-dependent exoDNAse (exonuclease V) beta subunit
VALLVRRLTPDFIEHHEKALTAQGVPYRLVGGKEYYARDEVKALANVLKAIDNPANRRAVFAALRSPFFGFSDDDLWQLVAKGGHLNYQAPVPGEARGADALVKAFDLLKTLHRRRRMFPPSDLIVRLFERTHALAAYRLRPATLTTLRTLVRHLEEETEGKTEEGDSPVGDQAGAQVQVLSVHRAKGLEYPIVVLGDILYGNSKARDCVVHHADKRGWLKIGPFEPEAWDDTVESEKAQSAAEERRLLYVALTRARDHLVIPCLPDDLPKGPMSSIIEGVIQPNRPVPFGRKASSLVEGGTKNGRAKIAFGDTPSLTYPGEAREHPSSMTTVEGSGEDAHRARGAESDWRRCRPSFRGAPSPSSDEEATIEPALSDHAAAAFGTLVHKLLALPESPTRDALLRTASTLAPALGLRQDDAHEAAHLAQHARDLPALAAARTADVIHRELPFVCRANGRPLVGRLDLAYRVAGAWTIIDFRTAPLASATEARSRYSPQVGRYRAALAALTGEPVSASLCLVRTGELVAIEEEPPPTAG